MLNAATTPFFRMSSSEEDVSSSSSANAVSDRILPRWMHLQLMGQLEKCGLYFYTCPACPMKFSLVGATVSGILEHIGTAHLRYMPYRCHAAVKKSRCTDHALHPDLMNTHMTDHRLQQYKQSAEILRRQLTDNKYYFSYLEVTMTGRQILFVCSNCPFTSSSLKDYKQHVVEKHVFVCLSLGGMIVKDPCLAVHGPPHDLS
jgi:hypothetical protein